MPRSTATAIEPGADSVSAAKSLSPYRLRALCLVMFTACGPIGRLPTGFLNITYLALYSFLVPLYLFQCAVLLLFSALHLSLRTNFLWFVRSWDHHDIGFLLMLCFRGQALWKASIIALCRFSTPHSSYEVVENSWFTRLVAIMEFRLVIKMSQSVFLMFL